jgi:hypothetical protein
MTGATADVTVLAPVLNEAGILRDTAATMLAQDFDDEIEYDYNCAHVFGIASGVNWRRTSTWSGMRLTRNVLRA